MKRQVVATLALFAALATTASAQAPNSYVVHNLASNVPDLAANTNPDVVNAWGLDASATSPWWIADNGADISSVLAPTGAALPIRPTVAGGPTGLVANTTAASFPVLGTKASFLFSSEDGAIRAWRGGFAAAMVVADRSNVGAIYKGLAIATNPDRLYATDFHNGRVDVFDGSFNLVSTPGAFTDPDVPSGFAPFGIQNVGGTIVVTFAKQDEAAEDELHHQGLGIVDAFDPAGHFLARIGTRGQLNAPWGIAHAPVEFGRFSGDLLIGNFGDGEITAFGQDDNGDWGPRGQLRGADHRPLAVDGLWALEFGHGAPNNGPVNTLFFTAGPNDEADGLFGSITAG
jgi:uncharacterized protein (TIGR03118 family)